MARLGRKSARRLLLAGLALLLAQGSAAAAPALWEARGPKATIYLFGTIHVLRKEVVWESPAIARALAQSQALWLEIPDPGNAQQAQLLVRQLGYDPQHPLSSKLAPADLAHLEAAAKTLALPEGEKTLEPMRPWLAATAIEDAMLVHAGYDPGSGVEPQLLHRASETGKSVHGFESMTQQLHFLADMAPALELQMLGSALQDVDQGTREIDGLVDAWASGDDAALAQATIEQVRQPFPALYRTLFVERNEAWAATIAEMAKGSGITFVAVGAGHLAGPDSVQAALRRRGIAVERVETAK